MGLLGKLKVKNKSRPRTLKTVLAIYFMPISVLPTIFISLYAMTLLKNSALEGIAQKARNSKTAIIHDIQNIERNLTEKTINLSLSPEIRKAFSNKLLPKITQIDQLRLYTIEGRHIISLNSSEIPFISSPTLKSLKKKTKLITYYFSDKGLLINFRIIVKDSYKIFGILETEKIINQPILLDFKSRYQSDLIVFKKDMVPIAATFSLSPELVKYVTKTAISNFQSLQKPQIISIGGNRFATFTYELAREKNDKGYISMFLPMASTDSILGKLRLAMLYLTILLVLLSALLIFVFSKRLVKPIESLVIAMKRSKGGRPDEIQELESTYEIEYLIQTFNEMTRNVISTKKALENKLEELSKANEEIRKTQATLIQSAKMISLGQLVAGVAHELNNPIAFIYSNMVHLMEYVKKLRTMIGHYKEAIKSDEKERISKLEKEYDIEYILSDMVELTKSCLDGATRTKDIVLGLRTFSRMEEKAFKKDNIHEALKNTVKLLATDFKDRINVHLELGDIPEIECNISQLNQVFMNLISNAVQAIEKRGDIFIRTSKDNNYVKIEIKDTGTGIPPEIMEKIFDPFFTTKGIGKGTGLGLSIAYSIVQKHNGSIEVESKLNKGTVFIVRLPIENKGKS